MSPSQVLSRPVAVFLIIGLVLIAIPFLGPSRSMLSLMAAMGINVVFALSYNMLMGQTGLLSFGHSVYFALGSYAALHAMNAIETASYDGGLWAFVPVFTLPILGFAGGALAGAVIGWPSCRSAGVAFSMISLAIAELMSVAGSLFVAVFGGEDGLTGDRMNGIPLFGLSLGPLSEMYWFIAFWTFAAALAMFAWTRTPLGKMCQAVRDNPERVSFVGYDPTRLRFLAFIAAGGFAGLAGGMSAVNYEIATPETFSIIPSGMVLLMAYIGGARHFAGPVLGAILLTYMQSNLSDYSEAWLLYLGLLFIVVVMFAPAGMSGVVLGLWTGLHGPTRRMFIGHWLRIAGSGAILFGGLILFVELAVRRNTIDQGFVPFGLYMRADHAWPWLFAVVMMVLGGVMLRGAARRSVAP